MIVEPRQKLKRDILEGKGRTMEQFHEPDPAIDLAQGRHRMMAEAGIGLAHEVREIGLCDPPAKERLHDASRESGIVEAGERPEIELGPGFRQVEAAIPGQPAQQDLVERQCRRSASSAEISQGTATLNGAWSEGWPAYRRAQGEARRGPCESALQRARHRGG